MWKITDMKPHVLILFLAALLAAPASAFPVSHSVPPESFLDYHVDTVPQLTFEVAYDHAVQARLAHHFHLSGPAMSDYVRRNLVLKHLAAPLRTRVYCLPRSGHEFYIVMTLPKGAPVFAFRRTGQPILRLVCGNPLVASLPPALKAAAAPARAAKTRVAAVRAARTVPPSPATISQASVTPGVTDASLSGMAAGPGEMVFTDMGGALSASWPAWASIAGGLFALWSPPSGGSASGAPGVVPVGGGQVPGGVPAPSPPPPSPLTPSPLTPSPRVSPLPVPEPSPALALLVGGLTLATFGLCRAILYSGR